MKINLEHYLSDAYIDASSRSSQRQLSLEISAIAETPDYSLPLNLCLVLDCSGSMEGTPLETVKQAAISIIDKLQPGDRISVIAFNHEAKTIVPYQPVADLVKIKHRINALKADGGTAIDQGMKLGIREISLGKRNTVSHICLLSDGENEHGEDQRCLKLAKLAAEYKITINTLGFGEHWNQDVLEKIADLANGTLSYIEEPEQVLFEFEQVFARLQTVGLTNAYLIVELSPGVILGKLKPITQVAPEAIEIPFKLEGNYVKVRIGDLMTDSARIFLINLYINQLSTGNYQIATVQVSYDNPKIGEENSLSPAFSIEITSQEDYQPQLNPKVQQSILLLAKYRQTQIAEAQLQQGDKLGAANMLRSAAKTALQLGDEASATVLQKSATRLQEGAELSAKERKQTRLASKTFL
ncbi:MAG: VWA domain-containing protein [Xenococcus sp. MO_188.B8]|nr:VWA domain-containing protein [Xenococcus sp. MO_188.B8]